MEKKLRYKFISITMGVVFTIMLIILLGLNIVNYTNIDEKANSVISLMERSGGTLPTEFESEMSKYGESAYAVRYFSVLVADDGTAVVDISNFRSITAEQAISIVGSLTKSEGIIGDYKYQTIDINGDSMVVFVDCSSEILMFKTAMVTSVYIAIVALLGVFVLTVIFSKKAVEPFVANNESQKKFITDVSHELKTPLAIIKANTEVLEMQNGESEFSLDIHKQVEGLSNLIMYLIKLSKTEESDNLTNVKFNFSSMLLNSCNNIAVLSSHKIIKDIKEDVYFHGDEQLLKILVSILLENAVKYGTGDISVLLDSKSLQVINPCDNIEIASYDMWFDRFYKADDSRNESNSFGIGLSMAKTIAEKHQKKISAFSEDGKNIVFKLSI